MDAPVKAEARDAFRPDIEGLRGVAVLLVVLFHSGLIALPGGFIGVDVFFVISGFLITGLLIREHDRSGTVRLRAFYARRVRRLLPAGMVALAVTLVAASLILAPLDRPGAALDAAATALSIGNIRFALAEGDYFATVAAPSPFLHFWSLAVEEQFYFVWPALVLVAARARLPRVGVGTMLAIVFAASLVANLVVSAIAVNWAFYSLPTRAWQLSLGGLLAVGAVPLARIPGLVSATAAWLGLAALVATAIVLDGSIPYPGAVALVPTLAAAALINAGMTARGPGRLLATAPLRFLGRISYSLYLWHWPLLVLPAVALEAEPPVDVRLALVGLAVAVAWLSWRCIEEPFRTGFPTLARYPGRTVLAGSTAVVLVVASAGGLALAAERDLGAHLPAAPVAAIQWDPEPSPTGLGSPTPPAWGSDPTVPASSPAPTGAPGPGTPPPTIAPTVTPPPVTYVRLPSDVRPALRDARLDEERLRGDGCLAFEGATKPRTCVYGEPDAPFTVALVGDSHAAQWFPAIEAVALHRHWRVLTYVKVACPFVDMPIRNIALKREYTECAAFRDATIAALGKVKPDLVLIGLSRFAIHPLTSDGRSLAVQSAAFARVVARLPGHVAIMVDTPEAGRDVPSCLSRHTADVGECAIEAAVAYRGNLGEIERLAAEATGADLIDFTGRVCRGDPCPVVVDGMIVFRDTRHITATFSRSMAPDLDRILARIIEVDHLQPPPVGTGT